MKYFLLFLIFNHNFFFYFYLFIYLFIFFINFYLIKRIGEKRLQLCNP